MFAGKSLPAQQWRFLFHRKRNGKNSTQSLLLYTKFYFIEQRAIKMGMLQLLSSKDISVQLD